MTTMIKTIKVQIKNVYGKDLIYPVCPQAQIFAAFTGNKTLSTRDIALIKDLGYQVELVNAYSL